MHIEDGSTTTGSSGGGASGKRRAKRNAGGGTTSKPLVVITELPYQTNKVGAGQDLWAASFDAPGFSGERADCSWAGHDAAEAGAAVTL
jgi:hypothetical protein